MILTLCEKVLNHNNFKHYPQDVKDEMRSLGCYWIVRGLKNVKLEMTGRQMFNYMTTAAFTAYIQTIKKYYKQLKLKQDLQEAALAKLQ